MFDHGEGYFRPLRSYQRPHPECHQFLQPYAKHAVRYAERASQRLSRQPWLHTTHATHIRQSDGRRDTVLQMAGSVLYLRQ